MSSYVFSSSSGDSKKDPSANASRGPDRRNFGYWLFSSLLGLAVHGSEALVTEASPPDPEAVSQPDSRIPGVEVEPAESPVEEKVKSIIVDLLGLDEEDVIGSASLTEDLGADSLDIVELVLAFEEEFGIEIPDEAAEEVDTVQDAIDLVEQRIRVAEEATF